MYIQAFHKNMGPRADQEVGAICPLELRRRGVWFLDFEKQEGNSLGERKANVWETNICWAIFNNGTQREL